MAINDQRIFDWIKRFQAAGWAVGLNSDRSIEQLQFYAKAFGTTGPIIGEKGNIVLFPGSKFPSIDPKITNIFDMVFAELVLRLRHELTENQVILGNPSTVLLQLNGCQPDQPFTVVVINTTRKTSFAINVKRVTKTGLLPDRVMLQRICRTVEDIFQNKFHIDPWTDINYDVYSSAIYHLPQASKANGVATLLKEGYTPPVVMVGDSMSDFMFMGPKQEPVIHLAVGNADPAYKEKCVYSARHHRTKGVVQCLSWLSKQKRQ